MGVGGVLKIQSCPSIFNQQASRTTTACRVRAGGGLVNYYFSNNGQPTTTAAGVGLVLYKCQSTTIGIIPPPRVTNFITNSSTPPIYLDYIGIIASNYN